MSPHAISLSANQTPQETLATKTALSSRLIFCVFSRNHLSLSLSFKYPLSSRLEAIAIRLNAPLSLSLSLFSHLVFDFFSLVTSFSSDLCFLFSLDLNFPRAFFLRFFWSFFVSVGLTQTTVVSLSLRLLWGAKEKWRTTECQRKSRRPWPTHGPKPSLRTEQEGYEQNKGHY